jgi:hypothetical protein
VLDVPERLIAIADEVIE